MESVAIITCVNYSDFLNLCLDSVTTKFNEVVVLTSKDDQETHAAAQYHRVRLIKTDAWYADGAKFNKAAALNECLSSIDVSKRRAIALLDADIWIPPTFILNLEMLESEVLYGAKRRMCEKPDHWTEFKEGLRPLDSFPINIPPIINGKLWGSLATDNPAAISGYFQLWLAGKNQPIRRMPESRNAASYDLAFALSFPSSRRRYLCDDCLLHLGESKQNWDGRVTQRWQ